MSPYTGELGENSPPVVDLTNGPVEGDSVEYRVHFYWIGDDPDGTVDHYEIALVDGDPIGFNPADTLGRDKWTSTSATDTLIFTTADEFDKTVTINESNYAIFGKMHTFFIRAIDDRGAVSATIYRSFNSWTLAPHIIINEPVNVNPDGNMQNLAPVIHFGWYGKDPVDSPWNYQDVDSIRFMWTPYHSTVIRDLNADPSMFEDRWTKWYSIDAPGDSGRTTILGDDEIMPTGRAYIFAVQAMDEAGAISSVFDERTNVRTFLVKTPTGPMLTVSEEFLGSWSFIGYDLDPVMLDVPPGFEMQFVWNADASDYGAIVSTYRYGWDITDFNDPSQWETLPVPDLHATVPKTFYSGIHTLFIEVTDNLGVSTLCAIQVSVIPVIMERDLLWVDDLPSTNFHQTIYAYPTEAEHDLFWTDICIKVPSFLPDRDIYDVAQNAYQPPPLRHIFKYKNLIYTYSPAVDQEQGCVWNILINYGQRQFLNFLPHYMAYGGHVWTTGLPQRTSGLSAVLTNRFRMFPCDLRCDMFDTSPACRSQAGMFSMAYEDFCVTMLDKVEAVIKPWLPFNRSRTLDAMRFATLDQNDPYTALYSGFPKKLELWEIATQPGMFFDPAVQGFLYFEAYDPEYWMQYRGAVSQGCFHPIYRTSAIVTRSVLHDVPIAFWTTKHADVVTPGNINVAAPSVHFGVPMWYFNRDQVDSIATVIFDTWQILEHEE